MNEKDRDMEGQTGRAIKINGHKNARKYACWLLLLLLVHMQTEEAVQAPQAMLAGGRWQVASVKRQQLRDSIDAISMQLIEHGVH